MNALAPCCLFFLMCLSQKSKLILLALLIPLTFKTPESIEEWMSQYQQLKEFIHKHYPGAEILITRKGEPPNDPHWEQLPFTWNEMSIWVRRHSIYDQQKDWYEKLLPVRGLTMPLEGRSTAGNLRESA